ncbi:RidA family protein [Mycobacterium sp. NPDC003323]
MTVRQFESFNVPWEKSYGYVQAARHGDTIYISGQFAHDGDKLVAPAPLDDSGNVTDFGNMAEQMQQTYVNAAELLARFDSSLADVIDEVIYVLDMDTAFAVAGAVRKAAYGTESPQVASTILVTPRLAMPSQLVEIKMIARV